VQAAIIGSDMVRGPRGPGDTRMMLRISSAVNLSLQRLLEKNAENA
jgi:hypothetical protein